MNPEPNKEMKTEEKLKILYEKYQKARDFGLTAQGKFAEFISNAENGMKTTKDFMEFPYMQSHPHVAQWVTHANTSCDAMQPIMYNVKRSVDVLTISMGTAALSGGAIEIALIRPEDAQKIYSNSAPHREMVRRDLDNFLEKFCQQFKDQPNLAQVRKGAWQTFYSGSEANLSQAAHSMRDIPAKIISLLAPNSEIEQAEWYQELKRKGERIKATEFDRLRYLIFGKTDKQEESILRLLNLPLEVLHESLNRLKSVAKSSHSNRLEVEACMNATEDLLLAIFKARNLRTDFSDQKELGVSK